MKINDFGSHTQTHQQQQHNLIKLDICIESDVDVIRASFAECLINFPGKWNMKNESLQNRYF